MIHVLQEEMKQNMSLTIFEEELYATCTESSLIHQIGASDLVQIKHPVVACFSMHEWCYQSESFGIKGTFVFSYVEDKSLICK